MRFFFIHRSKKQLEILCMTKWCVKRFLTPDAGRTTVKSHFFLNRKNNLNQESFDLKKTWTTYNLKLMLWNQSISWIDKVLPYYVFTQKFRKKEQGVNCEILWWFDWYDWMKKKEKKMLLLLTAIIQYTLRKKRTKWSCSFRFFFFNFCIFHQTSSMFFL